MVIIKQIASSERQPDTVAVTTHWHVPEGYNVDAAYIVTVFWSDMESAQHFANQNSMHPEMATLTTIETWHLNQQRISTN